MALLSAYMLMERRKAYFQMELSKELKKVELRQSSLQMDRKTFYSQMERGLKSFLMVKLERLIQTAKMRLHTEDDMVNCSINYESKRANKHIF